MKKALALIALVTVLAFGAGLLLFQENAPMPDAIFINDAVITALQMDDANESVIMLTERLSQAFGYMDAARASRDRNLRIALFLFIMAFAAISAAMCLHCDKSILRPFKKLQGFASQVAAGNLDVPLDMDKKNLFGAFSESFD